MFVEGTPDLCPTMCTVTFLPRPSGFILTHNRDEAPSRSPKSIVREKTPGGDLLLFPRDIQAGGTWIATSRQGRTACLLNGAFVLHQRVLPYRRSRGLMLLDFFDWENPDDFFQHYDLEGMEPFTFLFFQGSGLSGRADRITELRWDGLQRHQKDLPATEPHFWCSATLYPPEMQVRREQVFRDWLLSHSMTEPLPLQSRSFIPLITHLHRTGGIQDPENNFVMNRGGRVQTVSITQVIVHEKNARMRYFDLLGGNRSERRLSQSQRKAIAVNR